MKKNLICIFITVVLSLMNKSYSQDTTGGMLPQQEFKSILKQYTTQEIADTLWNEIAMHYSGPRRFYHTLRHLDNFYLQLSKCRKNITDWQSAVIAMVYHDVIYHSTDRRDEERSAELAMTRLNAIPKFPKEKIAKIGSMILATKTHAETDDTDTNLFNDGDMSILGLGRPVYEEYVKNIRAEFSNVPGFDAGRKKVLEYFLSMNKIFKSDFFHAQYEEAARRNIKWEITTL